MAIVTHVKDKKYRTINYKWRRARQIGQCVIGAIDFPRAGHARLACADTSPVIRDSAKNPPK